MPSWKKVIVSGSDAVLNDITLSGNIANTSGDFTIDIEGDLNLDANGADILLKDDGTAFGRFKRDSSDFVIKSETNNKDIVFRGQDGGATITAMTLDMSEGGNVGIGTTAPNSKLDIRRGSDGIALELHSTVGDADEFVDFKMISGNTTAGTLGTIFRHQRQGTGGGDMIIFTNPSLAGTPAETIRFTSDQKVGIGTDSPARKLEVKDTSSNVGIRLTTGTALDAIIDFGDTDDGDIGRIQYDNNTDKMHFRTNASDRLTIDSSGNINALTGNIEASGNISGSSVSSSGDILADGDVVAYNSSDMRLKNNLQVIEGALDKIDGINGYEFDWNDKSPGWARQRGHDVGVVAQEVQKIHPEIVEERKNGYLGVDYKRLVPLLIQSVKELKQEIDEIKQKCDCLNK